MEPEDLISRIVTKIKALEPEHAPNIITNLCLKKLNNLSLIRLAHGTDTLLQSFCRIAKTHYLGLTQIDFSMPLNIYQSSPKIWGNNFLQSLVRNPNGLPSEEELTNYVSLWPKPDPLNQEQEEMVNDLVDQLPHGKNTNFLLKQRNSFKKGVVEKTREGKDLIYKMIYLRFEPDCFLTKAEFITYFSEFGKVRDLMIPKQRTRWREYGIAIFFEARSVRNILTKENPHNIFGSFVFVEQYEEPEKIRERQQQKQKQKQKQEKIERGNVSSFTNSIKELQIKEPEKQVEVEEQFLLGFPPLSKTGKM